MAAFLAVMPPALLRQKFVVAYFTKDGRSADYVLAPAVRKSGACVFYVNDACAIHEVKPYECRRFLHSDSQHTVEARHAMIAERWSHERPQAQIRVWAMEAEG